MFDRKIYADYLSTTRKNDGTVHEYLNILENFHSFISDRAERSSAVGEFVAQYNVAHMQTVFRTVMSCLTEYAEYLRKNQNDSENIKIANAIKETFLSRYKKIAAEFALGRKKLIVPICTREKRVLRLGCWR